MFATTQEQQSSHDQITFNRDVIMPTDKYRQELYFIKDNTTSSARSDSLIHTYFDVASQLIHKYEGQLTIECHVEIMKNLHPRCTDDFLNTVPKIFTFGRTNSKGNVVPCKLIVDGNTRIAISYQKDYQIEAINMGHIGSLGAVRNVHELTTLLQSWMERIGMPKGSKVTNRSTFYRAIRLGSKN